MSTRFYFHTPGGDLTSSDTMEVTPATTAAWNAFTPRNHYLVHYSPRQDREQASTNTDLSGTSGHFTCAQRFVSAALAAQTISGTLKGMLYAYQQTTAENLTLAIAAKVVTSAGVDRGTLFGPSASDDLSQTPPELGVVFSSRKFQNSAESASLTLTDVVAQAGDRIVIEIGARQASTSTSISYGFEISSNRSAGDLAETNNILPDTEETGGNTWLEFSGDIVFAPFFFGAAATPADGAAATGVADPTAVTPPSNMVAGDLVLMIGHERATGSTLAVSATGGQTWNTLAAIGTTNVTARVFWCVFNGTWGANPSVDFGGTTCNSAQLLVFRGANRFTYPDLYTWVVNQAQVELDIAGSPAAITGQTTTGTDPTVTVAGWFSADDNTWGSISGTDWVVAGDAQYRNTSGSDQSSSYAYKIQTTAAATGSVTKTQAANGPDASTSFIITFAEVPWRSQDPINRSHAVTRAASY